MKKFIALLVLSAVAAPVLQAQMTVSPWRPVFQGIDHAVGTNFPDSTIPVLQVANCMRVDLRSPDIKLFASPPAPNFRLGTAETTTLSVSNFLKNHKLAVATDGNFYNSSGGTDPNSEGLSAVAYGMLVTTGAVVSLPEPPNLSGDGNGRYASLLFTSNNVPTINFTNRNAAQDTANIFTAVTGYYPILSNGVNMASAVAISYPDSSIHDLQPRTLLGLSADKRYLFMVTIDGRQNGYSEGSTDDHSARWLLRFGASDAINMDGGGSAAMYMSDCSGNPVAVNHSSYIDLRNRERYVGAQFGIAANPLPSTILNDLTVTPGVSTAIVRWNTDEPSTTQVEYGSTPGLGSSTPLDSTLRRQHVAVIGGLAAHTTYQYLAKSSTGQAAVSEGCNFSTLGQSPVESPLFEVTATWKYTTNNLDAANWKASGYDDSSWSGPGPGLLFVENNAAVFPRNTALPLNGASVMRTYYFRRHFTFTGTKASASLFFTANIDDGAAFYLNGAEIKRIRLPAAPTVLNNLTTATAQPCAGQPTANDAGCTDVFEIGSDQLGSLVVGDNVLAVELHNFTGSSSSLGDIVFGTSLKVRRVAIPDPDLKMITEDGGATLFWNESGFTLQRSSDLSNSAAWQDVAGPITLGPFSAPLSNTMFYRLRP